jgi:hypothetical protein
MVAAPHRVELLTVVRRYGLVLSRRAAAGHGCLRHLRQLASPAALYATILYHRRSHRRTSCMASSSSLFTRLGSRRAMAAQEGWPRLAMVVRHCYFCGPRYGRTSLPCCCAVAVPVSFVVHFLLQTLLAASSMSRLR